MKLLDPKVRPAIKQSITERPEAQRRLKQFFSIYIVSDVTFDSAVRIDQISVPFSDQVGDWPTGGSE